MALSNCFVCDEMDSTLTAGFMPKRKYLGNTVGYCMRVGNT